MATYMYKGRSHKVYTGKQGGKYIRSGGRKVYIKRCPKSKPCGRGCIQKKRKCHKGRKRRK